MTRSRKKTPCGHYVKKQTWYKGHYNRKLRRNPIDWAEGVSTLPDGNAFKKANESWEIDDYKAVHVSFKDYGCSTLCDDAKEDERACRNCYERFCIRK